MLCLKFIYESFVFIIFTLPTYKIKLASLKESKLLHLLLGKYKNINKSYYLGSPSWKHRARLDISFDAGLLTVSAFVRQNSKLIVKQFRLFEPKSPLKVSLIHRPKHVTVSRSKFLVVPKKLPPLPQWENKKLTRKDFQSIATDLILQYNKW